MVQPQGSYQTLEEFTGHALNILQELELPYRVVTTGRWFNKDTRSITTAHE